MKLFCKQVLQLARIRAAKRIAQEALADNAPQVMELKDVEKVIVCYPYSQGAVNAMRDLLANCPNGLTIVKREK
jgi:hypothetical protein